MRKIKNVFVNGISLVSKNETPAVEQAESGFALFKIKEKDFSEDIQKTKNNILKSEIQKIKQNLKCPFMEQ